jgi:hypothetical protein
MAEVIGGSTGTGMDMGGAEIMAASSGTGSSAKNASSSVNGSNAARDGFNASQYNIGQFQYPEDLYSNKSDYGGNYVIFYINVAEDSRILKTKKEPTIDPKDVPPRLRGDLAGQNYNTAQAMAGMALPQIGTAMVAGGVSGAVDGLTQGGKKGIVGVTSRVVGGALKGAATGFKASAIPAAAGSALGAGTISLAVGGKLGRQQKRLKKAIALHVPNQLSIRYGMQWDAEETATFQMGASGVDAPVEVAKAVGSAATFNGSGAMEHLGNAANTVGGIATSMALSKSPAALQAMSGLAPNPKKENLFKSVDFRSFSFDYQFFPRSPTEAQNVLNIIHEFKLHMHPEYKDSNNFVFIYPSEFDIAYYHDGKENKNLHRHTSCVLTEMNVNYTPNNMFNTFENGMPTQINVTMTFKELSILTKQQIEDNF